MWVVAIERLRRANSSTRSRISSVSWRAKRRTDPRAADTASSGNVFADLGLPQPDELLAKAALAHQIASIAQHRHLTQTETARLLGTSQPKISDLFVGRLAGFSMERLIRFLNALDCDVSIVVSPKPRARDHATVRVVGKGLVTGRRGARADTLIGGV